MTGEPMTDARIEQGVVFLLERAGPCRACELAEFIGVETYRVAGILASMRQAGKVEKTPYATTERWSLLLPPSPPPTPP